MTVLDTINSPADLRPSTDRSTGGVGSRHSAVSRPRRHVRRPPGPEPRRRRADHRPAPGLRLAERPDPVGHRPPGLRAQDPHRPPDGVRPAAPGAAACPATRRRAESAHDVDRELARLHRTVLCGRSGQGVRSCAASTTGGVVAVVGDGALTGGMCWEALNNIGAAPDRPVVIVLNDNGRSYAPDRRRSGRPPGRRCAAARPRPATCSSTSGSPTSARSTGTTWRLSRTRSAARPATCGGPVVVHCVTRRASGYAAGRDRTTPTGCTPSARSTRPPAPARPAAGRGPSVFADELVAIGAAAAGRRRHHRGDAATRPGSAPFAERFPDRVFDVGIAEQHAVTVGGRAGAGRAAPGGRDLRDVPQPGVRPGADGRRAAPAAGHVRARPGRHHRRRRAQPQRHVGPVAAAGGAGAADRRAARRATRLRELLREAVAVADGPTAVRFPKGAVGAGHAGRSTRSAACDVLRRTGRRTCCWSSVGAMARYVPRRRRPAGRARHRRRPSSTRAGSRRSTRRWSTLAAGTGWSSPSRTTAGSAASAPRLAQALRDAGVTPRCATSACRNGSWTTAAAGGHPAPTAA